MDPTLTERLAEQYGFAVVHTHDLDAFLQVRDDVVLFFAADPAQYPESSDVAVILPEIVRAFAGKLTAAVVARDSELDLQKRFGFLQWPALVFLRRGEYLGVISRVQDWPVYLSEVRRILQSAPGHAPAFRIPIVAAATSGCGH